MDLYEEVVFTAANDRPLLREEESAASPTEHPTNAAGRMTPVGPTGVSAAPTAHGVHPPQFAQSTMLILDSWLQSAEVASDPALFPRFCKSLLPLAFYLPVQCAAKLSWKGLN